MTEQTLPVENTGPTPRSAPPSADRMPARDRLVIGILLVSTFVVILNETIMSVALPALNADLGVEPSVGQWLTAGFLLTMAVVIPITGFLIQRLRTSVLFRVAMGLFATGTLVAALAPAFGVLLVARVIQATGTAIMMPLLMTTVMTLVPPQRRGAVMGNLSVVISVAPAIGPTVSGLVLNLGWRFMFWFVLPIALLVLAFGWVRMVDLGETTRTRIDAVSVVLSALGFGGLVYGLSILGQSAATRPVPAWVPLVVGAIGLALFVARQLQLQRTDSALLDLRTLRSRSFCVASTMIFLMFGTLLGTLVVLPFFLQDALGLSALSTGLIMLPGGLLMGLLGPVVGRLFDRFGARALLVPGMVVTAVAMWSATLFTVHTGVVALLVFHLLLSIGLAFVFPPLFTAGLGAVEPRFVSFGSAIFGTMQQLGGAAGVALLVSVFSLAASHVTSEGAVAATASGTHAAFLVGACLATIGIVAAFFVSTPSTAEGAPHH